MIYTALLECAAILAGPSAGGDSRAAVRIDGDSLPPNMTQNNSRAEIVEWHGKPVMRVDFDRVDWPNVFFKAPDGVWDWSEYEGLDVEVFNTGPTAINVSTRIDNPGADGFTGTWGNSGTVPPGEWATVRTYFYLSDQDTFWGMRGLPIIGPMSVGAKPIDLSRIAAFQVFLALPEKPHTLLIGGIQLIGKGEPLAKRVPMPFVDEFGQYAHDDWPAKVHSEQELRTRRAAEDVSYEAEPTLPGRDRFGGWAGGPKLEATGWFRTEKIDGRWWLVDPEGKLFFSTGLDCIGLGDRTFIDKREKWFAWMPEGDPRFAPCFADGEGSRMAETIGGKGRAFTFYRANLIRKYGEDYEREWRKRIYQRMNTWGFNTIGNWSDGAVLGESSVPYVASTGISGDIRRVAGVGESWGRLFDVYDPAFARAVESCIGGVAGGHAENPLCIGYFIDNELSWEDDLASGILASPVDQPCRAAMIEKLRSQYGSIAEINKAWGTDAADWDSLRASGSGSGSVRDRDLDEITYAFAARYFTLIKDALRKHAPNQLYLGCRFSVAPKRVVRACADIVDVVSFNLYHDSIDKAKWTGDNDLGKPIIIGEFHFGARDRGMFHSGLVDAKTQAGRAESYLRYVRSVADCPSFVGCHWFQFVDSPITGRCSDGENYNIGFVDVTDTPYPELLSAARRANSEVYTRHSGAR